MRQILVFFIHLYQRFISPIKGFRCAYHVLHGTGSCSSAVEKIILDNGLWGGWEEIQRRFQSCKLAHSQLKDAQRGLGAPKADLPCDLSCDVSGSSCGLDGPMSGRCGGCDLPCDLIDFSRRWRRWITLLLIILILVLGYCTYGRGVSSVYIIDSGVKSESIIDKLVHREHPKIRIVLIEDGKKFYSEAVQIDSDQSEYQLVFEEMPLGDIDTLKVLDARLTLGEDVAVLSQVLEEFDEPGRSGSGERFSYRVERRWHLF